MMAAGKVTILLVEDEDALREAYRDALVEFGGFHVVALRDGLDALEYLVDDGVSAIVLDLGLPRVSGVDLIAELRVHAATRQVPVIVVTGNPTAVNPDQVYCVLTKPVLPDDLVATVNKCIASKRKRRSNINARVAAADRARRKEIDH